MPSPHAIPFSSPDQARALGGRLDQGLSALESVQSNLERYRASVLKAASEGRLDLVARMGARPETSILPSAGEIIPRLLAARRLRSFEPRRSAAGREKPPAARHTHPPEPLPPDPAGLPPLPAGWIWVTLAQLSWDMSAGVGRSRSRPSARRQHPLEPGDFLVVCAAKEPGELGRGALVRQPSKIIDAWASSLVRCRLLLPEEIGEWVAVVWESPGTRDRVRALAGGTRIRSIGLDQLRRIALPLPPPAEREAILGETLKQLERTDELRAIADISLRRCRRMVEEIARPAPPPARRRRSRAGTHPDPGSGGERGSSPTGPAKRRPKAEGTH